MSDHNDGTWLEGDLFDDVESMTVHDESDLENVDKTSRQLTRELVEKAVAALAKDLVDVLQNEDAFQDLVTDLAREHATYKFVGGLKSSEVAGVPSGWDEEVEELQCEIHCMVGTQLAQRIFALAATEMYFPQGGRE
jgi:hypothetical protein